MHRAGMSAALVADASTVVEDDAVQWIKHAWSTASAPVVPPHVTFLSFPFDYCVSHRPGTRHGPGKILDALNGHSLYCTDRRSELSGVTLVNGGSVPALNDIRAYYEDVERAVASVPAGSRLVGLGGDHSVSDPIYRGQAARADGPVGLIMIDAHFDSRPPVAGREHSGHWVHTLGDLIDYQAVAQLGINASIYAGHYMEKAEASGILVRTLSEARQQHGKSLAAEALAHVKRKANSFHLSIDIDAIDQAFCPGTSVPNPCGFLPHEVADIVFFIAQDPGFLGLDIMEVSPPLDTNDRTSQVAAQLILHGLAGLVRGTPARQPQEAGLAQDPVVG